MRNFLFAILLICVQSISLAQRFNFINYSLEEGLPQSQVTDVNQDILGYLWIGTETGLARFDGLNFTTYSVQDGLPDNEIDRIYIDSKGVLWIATPKGIARRTSTEFESFPFSDSLHAEYQVNDLCELNGQIYLATDEGLFLFEKDTFKLIPFTTEIEVPLRALENIGDTILVCGSKNGFYKSDGNSLKYYGHPELDSLNISDLDLRANELIISTYGLGIVYLNLNDQTISFPEIPLSRIRSIYVTEQTVLCATKNGAVELSGDQVYHYTLKNGLPFENLRCVFIDRESNIWLGTDGKGLMKLTGKSVLSYTRSDGLGSDAVMSISQNAAGDFYFGTYDAGVTKWSELGDSSHAVIFNDKLKNSTVWTTLVLPDQSCLVGSSAGINLIKPDGSVSVVGELELTSKIRSILSVDDSIIYAGGSSGLFNLKLPDVKHLELTPVPDINKMSYHEGLWYLATTNGLYEFDGTKLHFIDLPENNVKTLTFDHSGNLWIGTNSSGVFVRTQAGDLYPFQLDAADDRSRTVLGLITDHAGNIWVSTLNGVYEVVRKTESGSFVIHHFGKPEGLITLECNQNSLFEDKDHFIWVGTSEGLVRIDPKLNETLFRFQRPEMLVTGIRLFREIFDYSEFATEFDPQSGVPTSITLPYNKNHLTFDFIGLNLKDPKGVFYEFRLLGAEDNWSPPTKNNYATYSFISHGEYDFEVRASNASGEWSETRRIHVIILPPFWLTWWFILLMVAMGILLIWGVFRIRIRAIRQKQENEQLGIKNRLLFLEQQSLNASMNRHFIFNSLNSIQYFINSSNKLAANKYLTSFAKLIRKNLDSSQANNFIVTLKEEIERIELYLSLEKMRFEGKFEYEIELDDELDPESVEIPSMILQPFVENSIIHGVLPLQRKGMIRLKIYLEFGFVVFEVLDDGIGIDNSMALKRSKPVEGDHESMGMEISNRRIELLRKLTGENLMIIGPFQVNNEAGESLGTKVIIKVNAEHIDFS